VAEAARADYLVTGDRAKLLQLGRHGATRIVTARQMAEALRV
jgi:predicted nucleic acid-binding protein